ncbi:MAG: DNA-formamidopyrimidine glycosylase [bacterium]|nr:DNA-formamidopyrimidine glycosylase [bacterium]
MPELPEVETIRRGLEKRIVGKTIADIDVRFPKTFVGSKSKVEGSKIKSVERRAKVLAVKLNNGGNLLFHLKMTGQLIYIDRNDKRFAGGHPDHNWHAKLPNSTTAVIFNFNDGTHLFFNDMRKFGWCKVLTDEQLNKIFTDEYGPEPFDKNFTVEYLMQRAAKIPNRKIKQFLTDQTIIAGIGNIYADELLFDARISPLRKVSEMNKSEWKKVIASTIKILNLAIKHGGTTDSDFVNADGEKGGMQDYLKVYRKSGSNCPGDCGGKVIRITVGGRGTHYCPVCQQ